MTASVLTRPTRALPAGARLIALAPDAAYAVRVLAAAAGGAALGTLAADGVDPSEIIVRDAGRLARAIVAHALDAPDAPSSQALAASADRLRAVLDYVRDHIPPSAAELMPRIDAPPLPLGQEWLHEAALEHHAHALVLLRHPVYEMVLGVRALHPAEAMARCAERVLTAVEGWAAHHELLELETEAAYWFSERWSAGADVESERGNRSVMRRMEWVFAERPSLAHGEPILASLLAMGQAEDWPAARVRAARALVGSVSGAFHVVRRTGDETAEARSLTGGETLRVRDPNGEALPGRVVLGRALPYGVGEHVFALSTELMSEAEPGELRALTADVRAFAGSGRLPLSIAIEATISDALYGARIPRPIRPAEDADDALARIDEAGDVLLRHGVARAVDADALPHDGPLPSGTSRDLLAVPDDPVLAAWMTALVDCARRPAHAPSGGGERLGR